MTEARIYRITEALSALNPISLTIQDDSHLHAGHAAMKGIKGKETHLHVTIQSAAFEGKSRIEQHRMVQELCQPEFETGLHALQITTRVP